MSLVQTAQVEIRLHLQDVHKVAATLDPATGTLKERRASLLDLGKAFRDDPLSMRQFFGNIIDRFSPGLLVGDDDPDLPTDNYDLERSFRLPKSHERRIHGHRHAGVRIVQEGPTLLPVLDAHARTSALFTHEELRPYANAKPPPCQIAAIYRRKIMRKARSTKKLPKLLDDLEKRYLNTS